MAIVSRARNRCLESKALFGRSAPLAPAHIGTYALAEKWTRERILPVMRYLCGGLSVPYEPGHSFLLVVNEGVTADVDDHSVDLTPGEIEWRFVVGRDW